MRWRAIGAGFLTDYITVAVLVGVGGTLSTVSGFYALLAPARIAPLLAGTVAGVLAVDSDLDQRTGARTGLVHAGAVVGLVLVGVAVSGLGNSSAGPLLALAVLGSAVYAWRHWATTHPRKSILVVGVLGGLLCTAVSAWRVVTVVAVEAILLLPRIGAFAFLGPLDYGRGWALLLVWIGVLLLGGAIGGGLAARR